MAIKAPIKNAEKILVLQHGNIIEAGTHDELIRKKGIYSNLVELQGIELSDESNVG